MFAKLERTKSIAQQNMKQTQNPTMGLGATINYKSTTTELPLRPDISLSHWGEGLKGILQILVT